MFPKTVSIRNCCLKDFLYHLDVRTDKYLSPFPQNQNCKFKNWLLRSDEMTAAMNLHHDILRGRSPAVENDELLKSYASRMRLKGAVNLSGFVLSASFFGF